MENKPYHHLENGRFRNPEGSPVRDMKFNWSYKIFNEEKKNSFKGKIGIFDIKNNKINHRLNFYKIEDQKLIEIF